MTTTTKKTPKEQPKEVDPGRGSLDYFRVLGRTGETDELYKRFIWEQLQGGTPLLWEYLAPVLRAAQRAAQGKLPYKEEIKHLQECITGLMLPFPYDETAWTDDRQFVPRPDALGTNGKWPVFRLTLSSTGASFPDADPPAPDSPLSPGELPHGDAVVS